MITTDEFRQEVERFVEEAEWTPTRFGKEAMNDPSFVFSLRKGRAPTLGSVQRVLDFIQLQRTATTPGATP